MDIQAQDHKTKLLISSYKGTGEKELPESCFKMLPLVEPFRGIILPHSALECIVLTVQYVFLTGITDPAYSLEKNKLTNFGANCVV